VTFNFDQRIHFIIAKYVNTSYINIVMNRNIASAMQDVIDQLISTSPQRFTKDYTAEDSRNITTNQKSPLEKHIQSTYRLYNFCPALLFQLKFFSFFIPYPLFLENYKRDYKKVITGGPIYQKQSKTLTLTEKNKTFDSCWNVGKFCIVLGSFWLFFGVKCYHL